MFVHLYVTTPYLVLRFLNLDLFSIFYGFSKFFCQFSGFFCDIWLEFWDPSGPEILVNNNISINSIIEKKFIPYHNAQQSYVFLCWISVIIFHWQKWEKCREFSCYMNCDIINVFFTDIDQVQVLRTMNSFSSWPTLSNKQKTFLN